MDLDKHELSSPFYSQEYISHVGGCEWLITAPEGNVISFEFLHFDVSIFTKYIVK